MTTKYRINPSSTIKPDTLKNIMVNLTSNISSLFGPNVNIIDEEIYQKSVKQILYVIGEYLKVYKFANNGIENIKIEIYNKHLDMVIYANFKITSYHYTFDYSDWINFFSGLIIKPLIVYNNMSLIEKNELILALAKGNFYLNDNVIFTIGTSVTQGILLKNKFIDETNYSLNNISQTNLFDLPTIYIVTLYWY